MESFIIICLIILSSFLGYKYFNAVALKELEEERNERLRNELKKVRDEFDQFKKEITKRNEPKVERSDPKRLNGSSNLRNKHQRWK